MPKITRLLCGAFVGVILGFLSAVIVVSIYHVVARTVEIHDTLGDLEEAEVLIFFAVFATSAVCIATVSAFTGNVEIRSPTKEIVVGVISGLVFAYLVAWLSAFTVQMTHGGKFPTDLLILILLVSAPICSTVLGLIGYRMARN